MRHDLWPSEVAQDRPISRRNKYSEAAFNLLAIVVILILVGLFLVGLAALLWAAGYFGSEVAKVFSI